jgi:hypothetical protein
MTVQFKSQNLRRITEDSKPSVKIRLLDGMPLILIKGSGDAQYGVTRGDKDDIVRDFDSHTDLLMWAWVGQWKTTIFMLTVEDLQQYY